MIRWKFVIPVGLVVSGLVVFFVFFFDPIMGRVIETVGGRVNGAKVNVDGFKTKFAQGRVSIERLQITNKEEPMQNAVEAGPLTFQLSLSELISKRVIINEATLSGLRFNTPRKTSGALPKRIVKVEEKEPSAASKLADKYKDRFKLNLDGMKADAKAKIEFNVEDLELVKVANELKETGEDLPAQWDKSIDELKAEDRLKKIEADLKSLKEIKLEGTQALTELPAALKKLKESKEELDQLKADVQELKTTAANQLQDLRNAPKTLMQAKKKDVDDLMSRFNLDFAQPNRLVEGMLGQALLVRVQQAMHYVDIARKHMPSQQEKDSLPEKPRLKGTDIEYPTPAALPRFWLMKAALDGQFQDVEASGVMTHLTTNPTRIGKPFQIQMNGTKGSQDFSLQAAFDHVGTNSRDSIALQADGLDVSQWTGESMAYLSSGAANMGLVLSLLDQKNLGGDIKFAFSKLKMNDAELQQLAGGDALKTRFITDIARAIENAPSVNVTAQIFGTWNDPSLKIDSNLTGLLTDVIKKSVGNLVQEQRRELEAKLDGIVKNKMAEVQAKLAPLEQKLGGQFGGVEKKVQDKINEAAGVNLGGGEGGGSPIPGVKVPDFKKLFKKK